jgi:hypothetical protein
VGWNPCLTKNSSFMTLCKSLNHSVTLCRKWKSEHCIPLESYLKAMCL